MIDEIVLCHVRIPPENSLIGNTHKGAAMHEVDFPDLPKNLKEFYNSVHTKLKQRYPEMLYSMDIGCGPAGPKLIEINTHTAFPRKDFKVFNSFLDTLIRVLTK